VGVAGFVDHSHSPFTQFRQNLIVSDCLADHASLSEGMVPRGDCREDVTRRTTVSQ
jgi:hypothetical protein